MKKRGFTLAEILIALGIVGVVSAVTIPALTQGHYKKVWSKTLPVAISNFENAMSVMIMREMANDLFETTAWSDDFQESVSKIFLISEANNYIDDLKDYTAYVAKNGVFYFVSKKESDNNSKKESDVIDKGGNLYSVAAEVVIDANGENKPNAKGRDLFYYLLGSNGKLYPVGGKDWAVYENKKETSEKSDCWDSGSGTENCGAYLAKNGYNMDY